MDEFYDNLIKHQISSQRWNAIVCDIVDLYSYKFPGQEFFNMEEFWDFLFTQRANHLDHHKKIWDTWDREKYNEFFSVVYIAIDDPPSSWWRSVTPHSLGS